MQFRKVQFNTVQYSAMQWQWGQCCSQCTMKCSCADIYWGHILHCTAELCDIYRDVTVSADFGYFEQYCNSTYPTLPDHIRLIINWPGTTWFRPDPTHNGLDTTKNYPNIAGYCPISSDIAGYCPILPHIVQYRLKYGQCECSQGIFWGQIACSTVWGLKRPLGTVWEAHTVLWGSVTASAVTVWMSCRLSLVTSSQLNLTITDWCW